ncbi:MAG: hypothetical protein JXR53_13750 [Bacteroidales bacterium]|nr:hypothetical protein [Bacteroidales bacterium]
MNNSDSKIKDNYLAHGLCINCKEESGEYTYCSSGTKLTVYDEFKDIMPPGTIDQYDCVEVRFKNNHKDFYKICGNLILSPGDIVAVEAVPGHDVGIVSLCGPSVFRQMKRKNADPKNPDIRKIYRKAKPTDIEKWYASIEREIHTLKRTRDIIEELKLNMKLNDVEYQGDGTKAIFYYTAEDRVDFRILIKMLADEFRIRIEMRQIGARQESAKLGGIGSCGRELCCSTYIHHFQSVSTNTARVQQLSLNPQKLAGQCGKLKCCLNYELPIYNEILKLFPDSHIPLKTKKGKAYHHKSDIFKELMWYSYENDAGSLMAIPIENVKKVLQLNKKGNFPENLEDFAISQENKFDDDTVSAKEDISKLAD